MKVGIIGAGFTGLSAGYYLTKEGHDVTIFDRDGVPGGLAIGFQEKNWEWSLEKHYHHWFTNDRSILSLARELNYKVFITRPKTSVYVDGKFFQLDSPLNVLQFPRLPIFDRIRMAFVLGLMRYNPFWKPLEKIRAVDFLPKVMGKRAYEKLWEPLFINKFGDRRHDISLAWFWARVRKRTPSLAYPQGGFLKFANHLANRIKKQKGKIFLNTEVISVESDKETKINIKRNLEIKSIKFDKILVTLPTFFFLKLAKNLPGDYVKRLSKLEGFGAINLVMRLDRKFLNDNTYWLNICDKNSPVMAVVEHTNFMNSKYYDREHVVYVANYFLPNDPHFKMTDNELLKECDPYLKKINSKYRENLISYSVFRTPFAQPLIPMNYSKMIPPIETPLKNVYLSNIQQVYPWDRGTNYSVENGREVAKMMMNLV
ncbi:MAG: NAD(P)/FAD-dependent oxidoreductase [Candidatus Levybacteria bacterium]|nr:NAD(P)/FAD-dependent oxidoreductase [Candidatus Levybacteria bacterium]